MLLWLLFPFAQTGSSFRAEMVLPCTLHAIMAKEMLTNISQSCLALGALWKNRGLAAAQFEKRHLQAKRG